MGRYYLAAAAIVLIGGSLAFAGRSLIAQRDWDVRATPRPNMTPTITRGQGLPSPKPAATYAGEGPWVMSALPGCFDEIKRVVGPSGNIHDLPRTADRVAAGTVLQWAMCRVRVRANDVFITRGADVLHVPPHAAFFHGVTGRLVLVWTRDGRTEIRTYAPR